MASDPAVDHREGDADTYVDAEFGGDDDDIEAIVGARRMALKAPNADGDVMQVLYKVKWRGAGEGEEEWFPREDLMADFPDVVLTYEAHTST